MKFSIEKNIYYHDTDCGGVVYYANYLKYFEEARTELFKDKGICLKDEAEKGTVFVVSRAEINYKSPAKYADNLTVTANIMKIKAASVILEQQIIRNEEILVDSQITMVSVGLDFKPKVIPADIKKALNL